MTLGESGPGSNENEGTPQGLSSYCVSMTQFLSVPHSYPLFYFFLAFLGLVKSFAIFCYVLKSSDQSS